MMLPLLYVVNAVGTAVSINGGNYGVATFSVMVGAFMLMVMNRG